MTELNTRLLDLIEPVASASGYEVVRVRVSGGERKTLQVMAERPDKTMTAEDCARLSRALSPVLDEADPIAGTYRLEVSSPGIDRPLVRLKDFHDWQGYEAKLELDRLVEGRKRFRGILAGIDGDHVCIDLDGEEETALLPFNWVASASLILTDELIRESLRAAKAEGRAPESDNDDNDSDDRDNDVSPDGHDADDHTRGSGTADDTADDGENAMNAKSEIPNAELTSADLSEADASSGELQ